MNDGILDAPASGIRWEWLHFDALTGRQVHDLMQLRQLVFLLEQRCLYRDLDGVDPKCWHGLGTTAEGELVACARLVPPAGALDEPSIGRVAVALPWRSRGLGRALMLTALAEAHVRYPTSAVRISAQAHLQSFYAQLGFSPIGDVYDDAGIPHLTMRRGSERKSAEGAC
jgi:ElaA protein